MKAIEEDGEYAHHGSERDFLDLTGGQEALIKHLQTRVETRGYKSGYVEHAAHMDLSAANHPSVAMLSAVFVVPATPKEFKVRLPGNHWPDCDQLFAAQVIYQKMKKLILSSFIVLIALLSACTSPQYNYQSEAVAISEPPLNSVVSVQIGEEMLKQGKFYERAAIRLSQDIKFGMFNMYTLTPGVYVKVGEDQDSDFYKPSDGKGGGFVKKAALADPWESIQLGKNGEKISVITIFHVRASEKAVGIIKTKQLSLADDSFQQTLIYSGKVGSKIKLGYREFSNNQARPAFNNDVEYDLAESKVIGYKGARLEVIEATNEGIKYRVIQNFNQSER